MLFLHYHLIDWASQSVEPCTVVSKIRGYLEWQMGTFLQKGKSQNQFHNIYLKKNLSTYMQQQPAKYTGVCNEECVLPAL